MLAFLRVCNLAVLRDVEISFGSGFNVLSGATGAGKSILVDAVGLLLGDRADGGRLRAGADTASVEGQFLAGRALVDEIESAGIPPCGEEGLIVRRELRRGAGNRVFVNGALTPLSVLRRLMGHQVAIHGQNSHLSLARPESAAAFFDSFLDAGAGLDDLAISWRALTRAMNSCSEHAARRASRDDRLEHLRRRLAEIDAVRPEPGEDEGLLAEERLLASATERRERADRLLAALLDGEDSVTAVLYRGLSDLTELAALDPRLSEEAGRLREAALCIEDVATTVRDSLPGDEVDAGRLSAVQVRLAELQGLARRHGGDLAAVCRVAEATREEIETLEDLGGTTRRLRAELAAAAGEFDRIARRVSAARRVAAEQMSTRTTALLGALGLQGARFEVTLDGTPPGEGASAAQILECGSSGGYERARFCFAAHPGDAPLPIARVASGGELSRLMLALHLVREGSGPAGGAPTLIFDEVDAGIGGEQATVLVRYLARVAADRQVICVTHLPQVAAGAGRHLQIRKVEREGRAQTDVVDLDRAGRVEEIARMLGGSGKPDTARSHAQALLSAAAENSRRPGARQRTPAGRARHAIP
ncbi:MAG: DNA repair protein RecN [Acidobacteriota bacterium]